MMRRPLTNSRNRRIGRRLWLEKLLQALAAAAILLGATAAIVMLRA